MPPRKKTRYKGQYDEEREEDDGMSGLSKETVDEMNEVFNMFQADGKTGREQGDDDEGEEEADGESIAPKGKRSNDPNDTIPVSSLKTACSALGCPVPEVISPSQFTLLKRTIDPQGVGRITRALFLQGLAAQLSERNIDDEVKRTFDQFDLHQRGLVGVDELLEIAHLLREDLSPEDLEEMVQVAMTLSPDPRHEYEQALSPKDFQVIMQKCKLI